MVLNDFVMIPGFIMLNSFEMLLDLTMSSGLLGFGIKVTSIYYLRFLTIALDDFEMLLDLTISRLFKIKQIESYIGR